MSRWLLLCALASSVAHAEPRRAPVVAELGALEIRSDTLDAARVRAGLTRQLAAATACATQVTWTTYLALVKIDGDKLAVLSKSQDPLMTRDPIAKTWGTGGPTGLADCLSRAFGAATFPTGTGTGSASLFVSVHPVLATSPRIVVGAVTATDVDTTKARAAIARRAELLTRCYAPAFWLSPTLAGKHTIEASLDRAGGVTAAQTSIPSKSLAACIVDATRATRFPAPRLAPATLTVAIELVPGA